MPAPGTGRHGSATGWCSAYRPRAEVGAGREGAYLATEGMLGGTGREATPGSTPAAHGGGHGSMNDKLLGASGRREGLLYSDDPPPPGAGGAREAAAYKRKQAQQQA